MKGVWKEKYEKLNEIYMCVCLLYFTVQYLHAKNLYEMHPDETLELIFSEYEQGIHIQ